MENIDLTSLVIKAVSFGRAIYISHMSGSSGRDITSNPATQVTKQTPALVGSASMDQSPHSALQVPQKQDITIQGEQNFAIYIAYW